MMRVSMSALQAFVERANRRAGASAPGTELREMGELYDEAVQLLRDLLKEQRESSSKLPAFSVAKEPCPKCGHVPRFGVAYRKANEDQNIPEEHLTLTCPGCAHVWPCQPMVPSHPVVQETSEDYAVGTLWSLDDLICFVNFMKSKVLSQGSQRKDADAIYRLLTDLKEFGATILQKYHADNVDAGGMTLLQARSCAGDCIRLLRALGVQTKTS
mgnify:CR=1 FL=1